MANTDDPLAILVAALKVVWDANSATLSGIDGFYWDSKPPEPSVGFPYCIMKAPDSILDQMTCLSELWDHEITFWVYDRTPELCKTSINKIKAVFDPDSLTNGAGASTLSLSAGTVLGHRAVRAGYEEQDLDVWRGKARYDFKTSKTRTS